MIRRLFVDIETAPLVIFSWKTGFKLTIRPESIISERKIIIIGWKWQGEKQAHALTWDKDQDDKKMLQEFIPVLNEADEIVGHWLENFDLPWIKTRALVHGIQTKPSYRTTDTCKWARKHFYFNSNKLDYLAKLLGLGGKIETGYDLWKDVVLKKCAKSLRFMVRYCKHDLFLLESVFEKLQAVCPHHTHAGVMMGNEKWTCPKDGSESTITEKKKVTAAGTVQWQMRCKNCGSYYTISQSAHNKYAEEKLRRKHAEEQKTRTGKR